MPIGALLGLALGGWLAELLGWRSTFYIFGATGLFVALLFFLTVREPLRPGAAGHPRREPRSFGTDFRVVARTATFMFLLGGLGFAGFAVTGLVRLVEGRVWEEFVSTRWISGGPATKKKKTK